MTDFLEDLWPHQRDGVISLWQSIKAGHRRPMFQLPTGGGKTKTAAAIIKRARAKGRRVVFTVPTISLIDQTVTAFGNEGLGHDIGVIQSDHPLTCEWKQIQIASLQTLAHRELPNTDMVIVDEAHLNYAVVRRWMKERPDLVFIGLTATPWTRGLGKTWDDLIIGTTTQALIDAGVLSPFRVYAPTHPDLKGVHTQAGDYVVDELAEAMDRPQLTADIVATWLALGENRPTLCFAVNRAHARSLEAEFERAGIATAYVDAYTPRAERTKTGEDLRAGRVKVVINVATLTTGVDWDCRCIILARPTKSENLYVQIIGRALRTAEGKVDALILDHSDTTLRLGFVTDIAHDHLDDGTPRTSAASRQAPKPKLPKECPSCHFVKAAGVHKCPKCGFAPVQRKGVDTADGDLVQMAGGKRQWTQQEKQRFWSGLLWYVDNRDKSEGWAAHTYQERFGVWPRGLSGIRREPDTLCRNWVKAKAIAYAKGMEKSKREASGAN